MLESRTPDRVKPLPGEPLRLIGIFLLLLCVVFFPVARESELIAAPPETDARGSLSIGIRGDQRALNDLFGEDMLTGNAANVCIAARSLDAEQRFKRLLDWVLPGEGRPVRMGGSIQRGGGAQTETPVADVQSFLRPLERYPESSWILCPARELVQTAKAQNRIADVRQRLNECRNVPSASTSYGVALMTLLEIADDDIDRVAMRIEERFTWERDPHDPDLSEQLWEDLLVLWATAENPATAHLVIAPLFGAFGELRIYTPSVKVDVIRDYLLLLRNRCDDRVKETTARPDGETGLGRLESTIGENMIAFARYDAGTHGRGRPLTRFHVGQQGATKISGHELDYLAWSSPLDGDFEASAQLSTTPGHFGEMIAHATAAIPTRDLNSVSLGSYAKSAWQLPLSPPLEPFENVSLLRVTSRQRQIQHSFNGRPIHQFTSDEPASPWVAFRNWRRTACDLENVRLDGTPEVPSSIQLLQDSSLAGWSSYHDPESNQGLGTWEMLATGDQSPELISNRTATVRGSHHENLIYYVHPICWDARIEYEFEYRSEPGNELTMVHPAFGRTVLMIGKNAVRLHRLTDGIYETANLRPDNAAPLDDNPLSPGEVLVEGWNKAVVNIKGSRLELSLNAHKIAALQVADDALRNFGLFHYRDQTQARVRNVNLSGDWPRQIPTGDEQPLASTLVASLNRSAEQLPAIWNYDFRNGFPQVHFDVEGNEQMIQTVPEGIRVHRTPNDGAKAIRFCGTIDGDFDLVATYRDLQISEAPITWHCGIGMAFHLENLTLNRCAINRRRDRMHGRHYVAFGQKETNAGGKTSWIGGTNLVDESTSGRLRLARRGTKVYALHAVEDSPAFRVVTTTDVPPGPIGVHGLRLIADIGKGLETSATWTGLEIRAGKIDLLLPSDPAALFESLAVERRALTKQESDFTDQSHTDAGFRPNTLIEGKVVWDQHGVTLSASGGTGNDRVQITRMLDHQGDFDIEVDFDVLRFESDLASRSSSEIVLQLAMRPMSPATPTTEFPSVREATFILRKKWNGALDLRPRVVASGRGGKTLYLPIRTMPVRIPNQFRIALCDQRLVFIYRDRDSGKTQIIAEYPLATDYQLVSANLHAIGGRAGQSAVVRWKRFCLYGSERSSVQSRPSETPSLTDN